VEWNGYGGENCRKRSVGYGGHWGGNLKKKYEGEGDKGTRLHAWGTFGEIGRKNWRGRGGLGTGGKLVVSYFEARGKASKSHGKKTGRGR